MRSELSPKLEAARVLGNPEDHPTYGAFNLYGPCGTELHIYASGAAPDDDLSKGWEHVSVSIKHRCPNWIEMCFVKNLFWTEEECVIQYHPPKSQWINNHPNCLHLWRWNVMPWPMPPAEMVGVKGLEPEVARKVMQQEQRKMQREGRRTLSAPAVLALMSLQGGRKL